MNMNVSLPDELAEYVKSKVSSGRYSSSSEVVREALRLLKDRDMERERLQVDVQAGLKQGASGRATRFDKAAGRRLAERIKADGRAKRAGRA